LRDGCCNRPPFEGNKQALGWALDSIATTIAFVGAGAFLATALIKIAKDEAGCQIEKLPGESKLPDCNKKVYGLKPSSLLSTFATVLGLVAAISMPLAVLLLTTLLTDEAWVDSWRAYSACRSFLPFSCRARIG
jgi:hypothetical protein